MLQPTGFSSGVDMRLPSKNPRRIERDDRSKCRRCKAQLTDKLAGDQNIIRMNDGAYEVELRGRLLCTLCLFEVTRWGKRMP